MGITNSYAKINAEDDEIDNETDYQAKIIRYKIEMEKYREKREKQNAEFKKKNKLISTFSKLMHEGNSEITLYEEKMNKYDNYDKDADVTLHNMYIMNNLRYKRFMDKINLM